LKGQKGQFVKDITEGARVESSFLVSRKETGLSKAGKPYLTMVLTDRTGELDARIWDDITALGAGFAKDDIVFVKGAAISYQGRIQLNIVDIKRAKEGGFSLQDFLPSSAKDPGAMMAEFDGMIAGVKDAHIRGLLESIFSDKEIRELFTLAPAAKTMHHPYLGGLLEHTLSLCVLGKFVAAHYGGGVNSDLLLAGLMLHDIGKIYELSYSKAFDYTDRGRLIGHISIGVELVGSKIKGLKDFPEDLSMLLKHILLSHHGLLEFGSPKRPKTLEALLVYYLDDLDAKTNSIQAVMEKRGGEGNWTEYQRILERYIYKGAYAAGEPPKEDKKDWGAEKEPELFRKG